MSLYSIIVITSIIPIMSIISIVFDYISYITYFWHVWILTGVSALTSQLLQPILIYRESEIEASPGDIVEDKASPGNSTRKENSKDLIILGNGVVTMRKLDLATLRPETEMIQNYATPPCHWARLSPSAPSSSVARTCLLRSTRTINFAYRSFTKQLRTAWARSLWTRSWKRTVKNWWPLWIGEKIATSHWCVRLPNITMAIYTMHWPICVVLMEAFHRMISMAHLWIFRSRREPQVLGTSFDSEACLEVMWLYSLLQLSALYHLFYKFLFHVRLFPFLVLDKVVCPLLVKYFGIPIMARYGTPLVPVKRHWTNCSRLKSTSTSCFFRGHWACVWFHSCLCSRYSSNGSFVKKMFMFNEHTLSIW